MAGIRILTWNVWGRNGPWEERQGAIAAVLAAEAPDVICLQEAWVVPDGPSQAALLAEQLGYQHVDADQHRRVRSAPTIGNAVLCRWPIERSETIWLPRLAGGLPYRPLSWTCQTARMLFGSRTQIWMWVSSLIQLPV